jgi:hypothetical protein
MFLVRFSHLKRGAQALVAKSKNGMRENPLSFQEDREPSSFFTSSSFANRSRNIDSKTKSHRHNQRMDRGATTQR